MVKSELINRIANQQDSLSLKDVELSVNHILECMSNALGKGTRIEIRGFAVLVCIIAHHVRHIIQRPAHEFIRKRNTRLISNPVKTSANASTKVD